MSYYLFSQPPYLLVLFGLLISLTCGVAFQTLLKSNVRQWYQMEKSDPSQVQTSSLLVTFLGICAGIFLFLTAGLEVVINAWQVSSAIALVLTLVTGRLVWSQLEKLLSKLQQEGSQGIDLENLF